MKKNLPITNIEKTFSNRANILSTTDLKGAITYVNGDFLDIAGFELDELIGKNHNVVRHPDMPPAAFGDLWANIKAGNTWRGIVKNRCKDGDHYWVDAYVTPIKHNGEVVEYQSVRSKPRPEYVKRAEKLYPQLMEGKIPKVVRADAMPLSWKLNISFMATLALTLLIALVTVGIHLSEAALVFAVGSVLSTVASLLITRPINMAVKEALSVNDNKISRYIFTGRNDELGSLMLAIKTLRSEAGGIVGRIADSSNSLDRATDELSQTVEITSQGVQQQYSETDQVATAVNEMSASINEVAGNAQLTSEASANANDEANNGKQVVQETINTIRGLASEVEKAGDVIRQVEQDSASISTILEVIRGISEQTNLLALNAAIEAARAGEQGRGFAVVADEVRTLANRTHQATAEIQEMIEKLQSGSRNAVKVMEHSREQAGESVAQAERAG